MSKITRQELASVLVTDLDSRATAAALTTHANLTTTAHGAVSAPTASTIVIRDAFGRAQVTAPAVAADIARLDTVTAHTGLTNNPHAVTAAQVGAVRLAGDAMTGRLDTRLATAQIEHTGTTGTLEITGSATMPAAMAFHRQGAFAVNFGLDTDNQLKVGGWSMGAVKHRLWHEGNDGSGSGLDADMVDGVHLTTSDAIGLRRITLSTAVASGGTDGDVWMRYT